MLKSNPKKKSDQLKKEYIAGYLFASPAIIGFAVLTVYPMISSLVYSFCKIDLMNRVKWIGFKNYITILTEPDADFRKSITVTMIYAAINVALIILFCLLAALLLNRKFVGRNLLRAIYFLPSVIPMLSTAIIWKVLLQNQAQGGLLNQLLMALGVQTREWLTDTTLIFVSLFLMSLWTCGGTIVVFLATLQDVPEEQNEAVEIDGGNAWHKFRVVTFPTIEPVIFFQLLICMMTSVQVFTQSVALSANGAPNHMTYFINVMIYNHAFVQIGTRGLACAEAWAVFVIILAITGLFFVLHNRISPESSYIPRRKRVGR